jgi:nitrate reductase NapAB chaperone NapD
MAHYIHHIPGRLRVRSATIKGKPRQAEAAQRAVLRMPGVLSAEVSTTTGSIVVTYDVQAVNPDTLLPALQELTGIGGDVALNTASGRIQATKDSQGTLSLIGKTVAGILVEKMVERSATALIAAFI